MWDSVRRDIVRPDHGIVIHKRWRPKWIGAGPAYLAPLRHKRPLLMDASHWLHVWTLFTHDVDTSGWEKQPDEFTDLVFDVEIHIRKPSGWYFTPPKHLRKMKWFPSAVEPVICEWGHEEEFNYWTEEAYNIERYLESTV